MTGFASRTDDIAPFQVMAILQQAQALAAQGIDVIHLEVGEPDFPTPEPITQAAIKALNEGKTHYTPALGLPELRQAIADFYQSRYGVEVSAKRIAITPGASGALLLLMAARLEAGDELLMADPGYPCNRHFARVFEAHGRLIPTTAESGFQLTAEQIKQHWHSGASKAVLMASPANPTGAMIPYEQLQEIAQQTRKLGGELWVDEIYHGLTYPNENESKRPQTALALGDDVVVINSFSKYFGMTGWRLGWMVVPEHYIGVIERLAQNLFLAPATPSQYGALAAFSEDSLTIMEARRVELQQRRDYLLTELPKLGFKIPVVPDGAFYIYADASGLTQDSQRFCQQLLQDTGVALTPGFDFGEQNAHLYIRFAYTTNIERLQQAIARIKTWLQKKELEK
ncbi:MAG: pyridoxal phosphate-dependent aminotransferase [Oleispira sp.]|nr:pyridoxal phosphate-dependent aminotransferase [Oleispira sp.]